MSGSTAFALVTVSTTGSPIITTDGSYTIVQFIGSGTFVVTGGSLTTDALVVAGGGGGGSAGGGGGGGGSISTTSYSVTGSVTVTIGSGGAGGVNNGHQGTNGASSTFSTITATGGGGGGGYSGGSGTPSGKSGGSGGGAAQEGGVVGSGISGQGYNGGSFQSSSNYQSGGGGGAGAVGANGSGTTGGNGGVGTTSSITGTSTYYSGGGGGGASGTAGSGGLGGGGGGGLLNVVGVNGTANTGGGGGGGAEGGGYFTGGNGGSGTVIVRYLTSDANPLLVAQTVTPLISVDRTTATLLGNVTSLGSSNVTRTGFHFGTSSSLSTYTDQHTDQVISSAPTAFHEDVSGLTCNLTYYYQAYAINSEGTSTGNIETFNSVICTNTLFFSDNFDNLNNGNIDGQNGWHKGGGTWNVSGSSDKIVTQSGNVNFNLDYISNGSASLTDERIKADFNINSSSSVNYAAQLWLRKTAATGDAGGYFFYYLSGVWHLAKHVAGSDGAFTDLKTVASPFTLSVSTWYTEEAEVVNDSSGNPVINFYLYNQNDPRPSTPTLSYTDTSQTFLSGYVALGSNGYLSYDHFYIYSSPFNTPSAASDLSATPGDEQVTLKWTAPFQGASAITDYLIEYKTLSASQWTAFVHTPSATTTIVINNLANDTSYDFRVSAINSSGTGNQSNMAVARPLTQILSDNFDNLSNGNINGQNGWSKAGGTWTVSGSSDKLVTQVGSAPFYLDYISNGSASLTDERIKVDFNIDPSSVIDYAPQLWLRKTAATGDSGGYFTSYFGGFWRIFISNPGSAGTYTDLADVVSPIPINFSTWYTEELEVVNDNSGNPVINFYIYPQNGLRPITPTNTYTDTAKTFLSGYAAIASNSNIISYDNFILSGKDTSAFRITTPAKLISTDPNVATKKIIDEGTSFYIPYIQTSTTLSVSADKGSTTVPVGGGVKFVLNKGLSNEQTLYSIGGSSPYSVDFTALSKGTYTLDAYIVDSSKVVQTGPSNHDVATQIGIGDIITGIGDSITAGYPYDFGPVSDWVSAIGLSDPISLDNRNYPQEDISSSLYRMSYLRELNDSLSAHFGYPMFIMNEGYSGYKASDFDSLILTSSWSNRQASLAPNRWLVHLGANDASNSVSSSTFSTNMQTIITALINTYNTTPKNIILSRPLYWQGNATTESFEQSYFTKISDLVSNNNLSSSVPDFYTYFQAHPELYVDSIHPNTAGYTAVASLFETSLESISSTAPTISTVTPLTTISEDSATLLGNISSIGTSNVTITGFHYGTDSTLDTYTDVHTASQNISSAPTAFHEDISGLTCNTIYYYKAYAINNDGASSGSIQNFVTDACVPHSPTVSTSQSILVSTTGSSTITTDGLYTVVTFTGDGSFSVTGGSITVDDLVVAGGGAGGGQNAGGGGAGGLIYTTSESVSGTSSITVGTGGIGTTGYSGGGNGSDSLFNGHTAIGGGGGGAYNGINGQNGGSGGGSGATGTHGNGTLGQGNNGGDGANLSPYAGGGGGGAGAVGETVNPGIGGVGLQYSISGTPTYYAGGGGGGGNSGSAAGGNGGGGHGENAESGGTPGTNGLGGGGGGGGETGDPNGGKDGGSGVVIIRYLTSAGSGATSITATSATLHGNISDIGSADVTATGFNYGTASTSLDLSIGSSSEDISTTTSFSEDVSGLTCNTTYYYQAYAVNSIGTSTGDVESFVTSACPTSAPTVSTITPLLTIGQTSATLLGNISDIGSSSVTTTGFNYGTDSLLSTSTDQHTDQVISSAPADFHEDISGLTCNTTYYYQAYAVNDTGTSTGDIENFLTSSCPVVAGSYTPANFIQTGNTTRSGTTNISVNLPSPAVMGDTLILVLAGNGNTNISAPAGFSTAINSSGSSGSQAIFYKVAAGGEQNFNLNGRFSINPGVIAAHIYEYSGSWTFISANSNNGVGSTADTGTETTDGTNNELIFGAIADGQSSSNFVSNNTNWPTFQERSDFITTSNNNATRRAGFSAGDLLTNSANTQYEDNPTISHSANWAGQIVRFHRNAPRVLSITRNNSTLTNASSVDYTVTFSSPVTGVDTGDFNLNTSGVSGASISSVSSDSGSTRTVTIDTGSGDGTIELDSVNDSSIVDEAGQTLTNTFSGQVYTIDKIQPEVSSIVRNAASPTTSGTVSWNINFSESVNFVNASDFDVTTLSGSIGTLNINSVTRISSTVYRVVVNTSTGDGEIRLDVRSDSDISDPAGNLLSNIPYQSGQTYIIDNTIPTLLSATTSASLINLASGGTFTATAVFSETMNTGVAPAFSFNPNLTNGGSPLLSFSSGSWTTTTLTNDTYIASYNLNASHALESSVAVSVSGARDPAGNQMTTTPDGNFTVDTIAPYLLSAQWTDIDNSGTINSGDTISLSFREMMNTGTTIDDTSFTLGGGHTFDIAGASTSPSWSDSSTLVITLGAGENIVSGDSVDLPHTFSVIFPHTFLDIHDNPAVSSPSPVLITDNVAPTVSSIVRVTDSSPTNSSTVHFTVTFSESVTGVDTSDFSLTTSGVYGASVASVTPVSSSIYTIEVNTGSGSGTIRLDVTSGANIADVGNNLLSNIPFTSGETYTIDKTKPAVSSVDSDSQTFNTATASPHKITITFSKDLNVSPVVSVSSVSQTVYDCGDSDDKTFCFDFTISSATEATDTIDISAGEDLVGNIMDANSSHTFHIDSLSPAVSSVAWVPANADTFISAGDSIIITFSEAMDKTTINSSNADSQLGLNNGHTFGTTGAGMSTVWNTAGTILTITLGSDITVAFGDTIDPLSSVTDIASNPDDTSSPFEILDFVGPTVTVNQANSQSDPTKNSPINFTVTFSEPVSDFTTDDVTLSGTAGATTALVTGTSTTYNIAVSGMTNDGTVIASINAGVATDTSNNTNATSTSADNIVTYDTTAPGLPNASLSPGTYNGTQLITLSSASSSFIRYTVDNLTDPTCSIGTLYSGSFSVSSSETVRAVGCDLAGNISTIASFAYTIHIQATGGGSGGGGGGGGGSFSFPSTVPGTTTSNSATSTINADYLKHLIELLKLYLLALQAAGQPIPPGLESFLPASTSTENINSHYQFAFTKILKLGVTDEEVRHLQAFLNTHGFPVSGTGVGSLGHETNYFGLKTKQALIKFQEAYAKDILIPQNLTKGTGTFGTYSKKIVNKILAGEN